MRKIKLHRRMIQGRYFVLVDDILQAMREYPQSRIEEILQSMVSDTPAMVKESSPSNQKKRGKKDDRLASLTEGHLRGARVMLWTNPCSRFVLKQLARQRWHGRTPTSAEAMVLDMVMSAYLQYSLTGRINFTHPEEIRLDALPDLNDKSRIRAIEQNRVIKIDLKELAFYLYPGVSTPNLRTARRKWMASVRKYAQRLEEYELFSILPPSPEEDENHILSLQLSLSLGSTLLYGIAPDPDCEGASVRCLPIQIDYIPVYMVRFMRGANKQYASCYTYGRLLFAWWGAECEKNPDASSTIEMPFNEMAQVTGQMTYEEWCDFVSKDDPIRRSPRGYMSGAVQLNFIQVPFRVRLVEGKESVKVALLTDVKSVTIIS